MAKKKEDIEDVEESAEAASSITPVNHDYQRDDLNEMRDKLNQLIEAHNSK